MEQRPMTTPFNTRGPAARMAIGAVLAIGLSAGLSALAPIQDTRTWGPINNVTVTFSVPETYSSCQSSGLTDAVTTNGIPSNWTLRGQILVGYINASGGFQVTQTILVNTPGNLNQPINYPPFSSIGLNPLGDYEYHVSPQIEVYDQFNQKLTWLGGDIVRAPGTLGPGGQDWDVFCIDPPTIPPPPPPPGDLAGCTPGYWKQPHHWDSYPVGVGPNTSFKSIFFLFPETATLPDVVWHFALDGGGGPGVEGALRNLRRAAAAAYLNSATVNYGATPAQIVQLVNAAATSNSRSTILALATALDNANNQGSCPLN
jgi:hypothetical protein